MILNERIEKFNNLKEKDGEYILFWMQGSQRTTYNHAFEYSKYLANKKNLPLLVYFGLTTNYPEANLRHYKFMLEGIKEVSQDLYSQNISFVILNISPDKGAINLSKKASLVVTDKGYVNIQKKWRKNVSENIDCPLYEIDTNLIIPVRYASDKKEYMAWTLRKKINSKKEKFLKPIEKVALKNKKKIEIFHNNKVTLENINNILDDLDLDTSVKGVETLIGGNSKAKYFLQDFIENKLANYSEKSGDPTENNISMLSSYLHFGQISPLFIYLEILKSNVSDENKENFLEQLLVRRELAFNFTYYNPDYEDLYKSIPNWAKKTLKEHQNDEREYIYNKDEFEKSKTHDKYWNSAQNQMVETGLMHGYMRMYWGKKILEWTKDPTIAYNIALYLNNKYALDGRDPNSYTGVAWCFGLHDRAWKERDFFGKIRYMNSNGLKRKFDIEKYVKNWNK